MLRFILLDIDDTILNFRDQAEPVIRESLAQFGLSFGEAEFAVYHRINNGLWADVVAGRLSRETLCAIRWKLVLDELQLQGDGAAIEAEFRRRLAFTAVPEDGAPEAIEALAKRFTLAIASNAPQWQQEQRLEKAGLAPYFTHVFTSGELGVDKPSPLFFERCLARLGNPEPSTVLMAGDDPGADVAGAAACGLQTCFVNTRGKSLPSGVSPTYTVTALRELPDLL